MQNPNDMKAGGWYPYLVSIICAAFLFQSAIGQTLFTYGNYKVSREEFLKAYRKNNTPAKATDKAYREYLELYTKYKLKVQAAYDLHLDTLPSLIAEMQSFRNQVASTYMNDDAYLNKLVNEAFNRSQKDIHLGEIFIASPAAGPPADTVKAYQKLVQVKDGIRRGIPFQTLAEKYSDDPFAKTNHGDIGYITVFTLPYPLENLAYGTRPGNYSAPYRNKSGYYIFRNMGERKALGKIRAAQILLVFPLNATEPAREEVKQRADSIRQALARGADFSSLASHFSGDNLSYQHGGEMALFGVGRYEEPFEKAAFALTKDGEISQPVMTSFGYHIIKRIARIPVPATASHEVLDQMKQQVLIDPRVEVARNAMTKKIFGLIGFRENRFNAGQLWTLTDSALQNRKLPRYPGLEESTVLFSFAKKEFTVMDWINYRLSIRNLVALTRDKSPRAILDQYEQNSALDYYRSHLEEYDQAFAYQLNEFRDGNLLFEMMQRKVWDKAAADSTGLKKYFGEHTEKYWWGPSANVVLFTCSNEQVAEEMQKELGKDVSQWRRLADSSNGLAQADSGRFEWSQLPPAESGGMKEGKFTAMSKNQQDNSVIFAYVVKLYPDRMPRNFEQARGLVINDYQGFLEEAWIRELKQKYPVKVDQAVLRGLPK